MSIICDLCHETVGRCLNCTKTFEIEEDLLCDEEGDHYCDETCLAESTATEARTIKGKE